MGIPSHHHLSSSIHKRQTQRKTSSSTFEYSRFFLTPPPFNTNDVLNDVNDDDVLFVRPRLLLFDRSIVFRQVRSERTPTPFFYATSDDAYKTVIKNPTL